MTEQLRIIGVELIEESMQTHQELHGQDKVAYPVIVHLSRPVDAIEAKALRADLHIRVDDNDPMTALISNTSIDALKEQITGLNGRIAAAVWRVHQSRDTAAAEDQRRREVAAELNAQLRES